jgi:hypothetical protein
MKKYNLYLKPIHPYAYRHKVKIEGREFEVMGIITGLYNIKPDNYDNNGNDLDFRICYEVTYLDGFVDYVPVSDVENGSWKIIE